MKTAAAVVCLFAAIPGSAQVGRGSTAAYSMRKVNNAYSGPAVQVRRSCDNLTADIGFTACGDLDTNALKAHVFGAPPLGAGSGAAMSYALRRIVCGYTGSAIRVRRSCDNAETDIGFTANGDLDTVALKNFVFGAGPLNMITPAANVAYSLRRMRCAYSGAAIRVRRSSDNATQDIGFTVSGDLDTAALKTFVGSGNGFVNIWYDQSGNAKNLSQANAGNQPQIVASGVVLRHNGKPTVRFTASSTQTLRFSGTISSGSGAFSLFAISSRTNTTLTAGSEIFGWGSNSGIGSRIGLWNDINTGNNSIELLNRAKIGNSTTAGALDIKTWIYSSGNISTGLTGYYNGSTFSTTLFGGQDVTPNVTGTEICMGAVPTTTAHPFDGTISEIIGFTSALSNADRQILEYLQSVYYNISGPAVAAVGSTAADAFVTTWYDQSGSARNAVQTTPASQPRIMNDGRIDRNNGKPTIMFDGANDYFTHNSFPTSGFTGFTANMLVRWTTTGTTISSIQALMDNDHRCPSGPTSGVGFIVQDRPDFLFRPVTFASPNSTSCNSLSDNVTTGNGTFRLLTLVNNGTSETIFRDGSAASTQAYSGSYIPQSRFVIGAWWNLGTVQRFMNGSMSEITIFPLGLSTSARQILEYNQAVYYGISGPASVTSSNAPSGFVTTWYDQSGNGNHMTQTTASRQPVIVQAGRIIRLNGGMPALRASGPRQTNLQVVLPSAVTGTTLSLHTLFQPDTALNANNRIVSVGNATFTSNDWNNVAYFNLNQRTVSGSNGLAVERNGAGSPGVNPQANWTTGNAYAISTRFNGTTHNLVLNGTSAGNIADANSFNFRSIRLLQSINPGFETTEGITGRMAEFIMFAPGQNATRTTLEENDQTQYAGLTQTNDKYTPADAAYFRNLRGIGRESSTDSVQRNRISRGFIIEDDAASGSNFLRDNGDYMVAGEICDNNAATTTADLSQNVQQRWLTSWEVKRTDVSNNGGRVRFIFDYSDYWQNGFTPLAAASKYVLLKRNTSSGAFDTLNVISKQVSGDRVIFTLDAINVNTFFTIGTMNTTLAPLPVEMTSFRCNKTSDNQVTLNWQTVSEQNAEYFSVERSADGKSYEAIGKVKAAGNSNELRGYQYRDMSPLSGVNFYRLKQVDFNGASTTSAPCVVRNEAAHAGGQVRVYPNPAQTQLNVELGEIAASEISLINYLGETVYRVQPGQGQAGLKIDLASFTPGMYLVQVVSADFGVQNFKVVVQK